MTRRWSRVLALVTACALAAPALAAQQRDTLAPRADSLAAADTMKRRAAPADTAGRGAPADSTQAVPAGPETYIMVDTIIVLEDVRGLVWGDWYVNPDVGAQIQAAIQRRGQLSGRTWLESSAPIRDLALGKPSGNTQNLSFVDKGVALNFWEPDEVDYRYVFDGPWGLKASGTARPGQGGPRSQVVRIPLPITEPPNRASLESRTRVGRLDITYRSRTRSGGIPRGRFTIYLYYLNPQLGYRIAGVGY